MMMLMFQWALPTGTLTQQALVATAIGVATLTTQLNIFISMVSTAVGNATLTTTALIRQTLAAIASGIATLTTQFIAAGAGGIQRFEWLKWIYGKYRRGRRR